jgi:DMSO/TMAO reductase YedYZ molybdopterin-dependent catalytic subunit
MKKTSLAIIGIIVIVIVAASSASYYLLTKPSTSLSNQLPTGDAPQWQIQLTGDVQQEKTVTLQQLTQMPLSNVTTKDNSTIYIGVSLNDFCNQTGLNWDAGGIQVIGENGKNATINMYQAYNSTFSTWFYHSYNTIMLAFVKNGQWMTNETDGCCVKLNTPNFNDSYQISSVSTINIKPWTITVRGNVANPITLTAANMSLIKTTTINATTCYAGFDNITANWTGTLIMDVLSYANVSVSAYQVTLVGIDGKTCLGVSVVGNFTFAELTSGKMMIGYQIDGKTLSIDKGGPYKTFCPTTEPPFRITTYWMKWLHEIIVY